MESVAPPRSRKRTAPRLLHFDGTDASVQPAWKALGQPVVTEQFQIRLARGATIPMETALRYYSALRMFEWLNLPFPTPTFQPDPRFAEMEALTLAAMDAKGDYDLFCELSTQRLDLFDQCASKMKQETYVNDNFSSMVRMLLLNLEQYWKDKDNHTAYSVVQTTVLFGAYVDIPLWDGFFEKVYTIFTDTSFECLRDDIFKHPIQATEIMGLFELYRPRKWEPIMTSFVRSFTPPSSPPDSPEVATTTNTQLQQWFSATRGQSHSILTIGSSCVTDYPIYISAINQWWSRRQIDREKWTVVPEAIKTQSTPFPLFTHPPTHAHVGFYLRNDSHVVAGWWVRDQGVYLLDEMPIEGIGQTFGSVKVIPTVASYDYHTRQVMYHVDQIGGFCGFWATFWLVFYPLYCVDHPTATPKDAQDAVIEWIGPKGSRRAAHKVYRLMQGFLSELMTTSSALLTRAQSTRGSRKRSKHK